MARPIEIKWRSGDTAALLLRRLEDPNNEPFRERLHLLWRLRLGDSVSEASSVLNIKYRTASRYVQIYRNGGLSAILTPPGHGGGASERLSDEQWEQLKEHLRLGTTRTARMLLTWIQSTFNVTYSVEYLRQRLKQKGIVLKVPRPYSNKSNKAERDAWKKGASKKLSQNVS